MAGTIEGILRAMGLVLDEIAGIRSTKLLDDGSVGDTYVLVETTEDWESSGAIVIDGVRYAYTSKTLNTLQGLSHQLNGNTIAGLKQNHTAPAEVVDFSMAYSALDRLRGSLFVNLAVGNDLSIVGRNLGVFRRPELDDATFRELIKAIAFTPKGTIYCLELAATAFFGAGNFTIHEDLINHPNTVFINVDSAAAGIDTGSAGNTYVGQSDILPLDDATSEITLTETPVGLLQSVQLADENFDERLDAAKPSGFTEIRYDGDAGIAVWTYEGANEGTAVVVDPADGVVNTFDATGGDLPRYVHQARLTPESRAQLSVRLTADASIDGALGGLDGRAFALEMHCQDVAARVGIFQLVGGQWFPAFMDAAGAPLADQVGVATPLAFDTYSDISLARDGDFFLLLQGGTVKAHVKASSFPASTDHLMRFGTTAGSIFVGRVMRLGYFASTPTDYGGLRGTTAQVATAQPTALDTNSAALVAGDVGRGVRLFDSAVSNPMGGTNDGQWIVETFVDADVCTLSGETRDGGIVESGFPSRITVVDDRAFNAPTLKGHTFQILGVGPNIGEWTIAHVIDPVTNLPFIAGESGQSDQVLVVGSAAGSSGVDGAVAAANPDRFVDATASAFTPADVGRFILVKDADNNVNMGVFRIDAYIDPDTVETNSVDIGQPFDDETNIVWELRNQTGWTTESGLQWRVKPAFVDENPVAYSLAGGSDVTGPVVTLRNNPPGFNFVNIELIMKVVYTMVLSAHLLPDEQITNALIPATDPKEYEHYPFYMPTDSLATFQAYLDDLTAAGVIPEVDLE